MCTARHLEVTGLEWSALTEVEDIAALRHRKQTHTHNTNFGPEFQEYISSRTHGAHLSGEQQSAEKGSESTSPPPDMLLCLVSASFVQSEHRTVKSPPPAQKSVRNETSRNR